MKREQLQQPVLDALAANGGRARIADVCKYVWENFENDLKDSGRYFYTWQYELRWASDQLVKSGKIKKGNPRGVWKILEDKTKASTELG